MKKVILKNLKDLFLLFITYFGVTLIMSIAFQRNGFISSSYALTTGVFMIAAIVYKLICTINDCRKN